MVASGAFWGPNFVLQGSTKVYFVFLYIHAKSKRNATEMVVSGAFWGPNFVL